MVEGIQLRPIGHVARPRTEAIDDDWGSIESTIALDADRFEADVVLALRGADIAEDGVPELTPKRIRIGCTPSGAEDRNFKLRSGDHAE